MKIYKKKKDTQILILYKKKKESTKTQNRFGVISSEHCATCILEEIQIKIMTKKRSHFLTILKVRVALFLKIKVLC